MDKEELKREFKELDSYLDELCLRGHKIKDSGHLWIAFTDKFNALKKKILQWYTTQTPKQ